MKTGVVMIKFYKLKDPYGCFSNFSRNGFDLDGKYWKTSEHYYQAQKFSGTKHEEEVRVCESPREAANMGRRRDLPLRPDWEEIKDSIMYKCLKAKFSQNSDILSILISTGKEEIVEDSKVDYYWGCGEDNSGKNMLGKLLVKVRDELI